MSYRFERLEWKPSCPNFLPLERLHSSLSSPVARSAAELRAQKVSIGSHCERRSDHFPSEAEDIHIVIFDALARGERVVYRPSANVGDLVGNNARADAAAANRDPPFDIARSDRSGEGNDKVWIIVLRVQQGGAEVEDFMPSACNASAISAFSAKPPWSEAIPMRIAVTPDIELAARLQRTTCRRVPYCGFRRGDR